MFFLFADADVTPVIQVSWQGLAAAGVSIGGSIVAAAKIISAQWEKNSREVNEGINQRHAENRQDSKEHRDENRELSKLILDIQGKTVETLVGLNSQIELMTEFLKKVQCHGETKR